MSKKPEIAYRLTSDPAPPYTQLFDLTVEGIRMNPEVVAQYLQQLKEHRKRIAAAGGRATKGINTPEKQRASRENGKLGGRPRKNKI